MFLSTAKNIKSLTFYDYVHWVKAVHNINTISFVYFKVVGKVLKLKLRLKLGKMNFFNFKTRIVPIEKILPKRYCALYC